MMSTTMLQDPSASKTKGSHDVLSSFNCLDMSQGVKPMKVTEDLYEDPESKDMLDIPENQTRMIQQQHIVKDITNTMYEYTLDVNGFQFVKHQTKLKRHEFGNSAKVKSDYEPESIELIKKITGASYVLPYDHGTRISSEDPTGNPIFMPAFYVHSDQGPAGGPFIVKNRAPKELIDTILTKRFQIINVWRPLKPIYKDPFAVADATTISDKDISSFPIEGPYGYEEAGSAYVRPEQSWVYKFGQQPDEVLLFKCYDSLNDGKTARQVFHSAFADPSQAHMPPRESSELRCLVVYDM